MHMTKQRIKLYPIERSKRNMWWDEEDEKPFGIGKKKYNWNGQCECAVLWVHIVFWCQCYTNWCTALYSENCKTD